MSRRDVACYNNYKITSLPALHGRLFFRELSNHLVEAFTWGVGRNGCEMNDELQAFNNKNPPSATVNKPSEVIQQVP